MAAPLERPNSTQDPCVKRCVQAAQYTFSDCYSCREVGMSTALRLSPAKVVGVAFGSDPYQSAAGPLLFSFSEEEAEMNQSCVS